MRLHSRPRFRLRAPALHLPRLRRRRPSHPRPKAQRPATPRATPPVPSVPHRPARAPWWVRTLTTAGRPVVAAMVLIMCAPGEHHLAVLAGWDTRLAWGMAAVLAAYAGIAAAVASARPAGAPGKLSAVVGAWLSLAAAMSAQPTSHLFVTGHLTAEPRPPVWLVIAVSCVPPLVLGHLLHLAATPVPSVPANEPNETRDEQPETPPVPPDTDEEINETDDRDDDEQHDEPDPGRRLLTTREVAARYGISVSTVRTWKDRGRIVPAVTDPALGNLYNPETLPAAA